MNADPDRPANSDEQTLLQRAIRARALDTIKMQTDQPKPSLWRRLLVSAMVLATLLALVAMIDLGVRVMHHIMQIWGYEAVPTPPPVIDPDQPFYITVEPPVETDPSPAALPEQSGSSSDKN